MAETSPGDNGDNGGPTVITDSLSDSQPSSLLTNDGSFEVIDSHPSAKMFQCIKG